ncbi:NADP-dependent oxidoreductase [Salinispora oceanensis]|uniref:NADP-dependent oxidoreductase n=1 Tax=Salinispora oceanensis TaxID=1050199 RepID=UPI00035EA176|nr:NADP-dependent oxidoreductase [Salinispora oceanensis]
MKAAGFSTFGGPEVLDLIEVPAPQAGPGQVRVRVKAAGVQPFDIGIRQGWAPPSIDPTLPRIPGNEFSGLVDQVGDGVTGFPTGTPVLGYSLLGSYAEYVVVPADQIVVKPEVLPWEMAGGFSGNAQGAHMALEAMTIRPGDTVLVHGAAGGLGTFAVQLARAWGATAVIGTASEANHDYLRAIGAIPVAYGDGLLDRLRAVAPDGADAALDAAGPEALYASVELVKDRNRIRTMVSDEAAEELGIPALGPGRSAARLGEMVDLYTQDKFKLHVRHAYPLAEAAAAHRDVESGHGRGKIVLLADDTGNTR